MQYLAGERVNKGRQPEIDLLKAVCILIMVFCHSYIFLTSYNAGAVWFLNEIVVVMVGIGGFMVPMGITMHYTRDQSPRAYALRGLSILTAAQGLNLLRNALPNLIVYWCSGSQWFIAQAFLVLQADILSFAGLAFLLIAVVRRLRLPGAGVFLMGLVMNLLSWPLSTLVPAESSYLFRQLLGYFILTDAEAYFPLFSNFMLVGFGYWLGEIYPRIADKDALAKRALAVLVPVYAVYQAIRMTVGIPVLPEYQSDLQYTLQYGPDGIMDCILVLILLALFHLLLRKTGGRLHPAFRHLSENINGYYWLSCLFISPLMTFLIARYHRLLQGWLVPMLHAVAVLLISAGILQLYANWRRKRGTQTTNRARAVWVVLAWTLTILVVAYVYPRVEVFPNVWNGYLLP